MIDRSRVGRRATTMSTRALTALTGPTGPGWFGPLRFPRPRNKRQTTKTTTKMAAERTASDGAIVARNHRIHAYADAVHVLIEAKNASGFLPPRRSSLAPPSSSAKRQRTATTLHPSIPVPDALIASLSSTALGQFVLIHVLRVPRDIELTVLHLSFVNTIFSPF
jgi:hypothetical protein